MLLRLIVCSGNGPFETLIVNLGRQIVSTASVYIDSTVGISEDIAKVQRPTCTYGFKEIKSKALHLIVSGSKKRVILIMRFILIAILRRKLPILPQGLGITKFQTIIFIKLITGIGTIIL